MSAWNSSDPYGMAVVITRSAMPLEEDDRRLIARVIDYPDSPVSVYDMLRLNNLCYMTLGFALAKSEKVV